MKPLPSKPWEKITMGKTKRNACRWMESRFKLGDTHYPEENESHYFNGRYQNKMRNGNHSYYALFIDPESMKVRCWRQCGHWAKPLAKRAARHNAKLLIIKLTHIIMDEVWQEEQTQMWGDDEDMIGFDFSYSDQAFDYAFDLVLKNGTVFTAWGITATDVGVRNGRIAAIGALGSRRLPRCVTCAGCTCCPGQSTVRFTFATGPTHKEDLETGSRAAVLGGVTSVFEMPNTAPPTTSADALNEKLTRARGRMWCDYAFYVGATPENAEALGDLEKLPGAAGVKMCMGSSTGTLLVADDEHVERVLRHGRRRVAVHAEDETRLNERKGLRVPGDPRSHPVWRDAEAALLATKEDERPDIIREARFDPLFVVSLFGIYPEF